MMIKKVEFWILPGSQSVERSDLNRSDQKNHYFSDLDLIFENEI